jgi:hypothetical protein
MPWNGTSDYINRGASTTAIASSFTQNIRLSSRTVEVTGLRPLFAAYPLVQPVVLCGSTFSYGTLTTPQWTAPNAAGIGVVTPSVLPPIFPISLAITEQGTSYYGLDVQFRSSPGQ